MIGHRLALRIGAVLFTCSIALGCTEAQMQSSIADLTVQRTAVVRIRSIPQDRAVQNFAGLYVGRDQQNAFFITALHPLRNLSGSNDPADPVPTAQVQFSGGPTYVAATVLTSWDSAADLAVIYIPATKLQAGMVSMYSKDPAPEMPIHIIGHPPGGSWTSWIGRVQNEIEVAGDGKLFSTGSDQSLTDGYSGGPVLDSAGDFIGMHLGSYGSYAKNLKSSVILTALRAWHVPVENIGNSPPIIIIKPESVDVTFIWRGMMTVDKSAHKYLPIVGSVTVFIDGKEVNKVSTRDTSERDTVSLSPGTHHFTFESVVDTDKTRGARSSCNGNFTVNDAVVIHPRLTFFGDGVARNCMMQ
jgi:S1-C subfamily serine protease